MKIIDKYPPCWDEANEKFKLEEKGMRPVFTYGDVMYNPFGLEMDALLIRHEETHMEQQQSDPAVASIWWKRYIQDPEFRCDQEAEAYGAQYKLYCQIERDRNKQAKYLWRLADTMSSDMYEKMIGFSDAMTAIKSYALDMHTGD